MDRFIYDGGFTAFMDGTKESAERAGFHSKQPERGQR
jgi:hypothetical protein